MKDQIEALLKETQDKLGLIFLDLDIPGDKVFTYIVVTEDLINALKWALEEVCNLERLDKGFEE